MSKKYTGIVIIVLVPFVNNASDEYTTLNMIFLKMESRAKI